jgi:transposase
MVTIGIDPHKDTHQAVAVDLVGKKLAEKTCDAVADGFGQLLAWARGQGEERVWVIEDCRHVSGPLERFLLDRGESVARLAPHLMAEARTHVGLRGKSNRSTLSRSLEQRWHTDWRTSRPRGSRGLTWKSG